MRVDALEHHLVRGVDRRTNRTVPRLGVPIDHALSFSVSTQAEGVSGRRTSGIRRSVFA